MPKKIESWIFSLVGYAQSFKVDLIAIMQQNIDTIGMIKAIVISPLSFLFILCYAFYKKLNLWQGAHPRGVKVKKDNHLELEKFSANFWNWKFVLAKN